MSNTLKSVYASLNDKAKSQLCIVATDKDQTFDVVLAGYFDSNMPGNPRLMTNDVDAAISPFTGKTLTATEAEKIRMPKVEVAKLPVIATCSTCDSDLRTFATVAKALEDAETSTIFCTVCESPIKLTAADDEDEDKGDKSDDDEDKDDD